MGGGLDWCDRGDGRRLNIRPQPLEVANHGDDLAIRLGGYQANLKVLDDLDRLRLQVLLGRAILVTLRIG